MRIFSATYQNQGKRFLQQDVVFQSKNKLFSLVCDGIGSNTQSGFFAEHIVRSLYEFYKRFDWGKSLELKDELKNALSISANKFKQNNLDVLDTNNLGCTLAMVIIRDQNIIATHIGDSKIILFNQNRIIYTSKDHTLGEVLKNNLESDDYNILDSKLKHQLVRAVGLDANIIEPDVKVFPLNEDQIHCLIATDGVFEANVDIFHLFSELPVSHALRNLNESIMQNSKDNSSYIFVSIVPENKPTLDTYLYYLILFSAVFSGIIYLWYFFVK